MRATEPPGGGAAARGLRGRGTPRHDLAYAHSTVSILWILPLVIVAAGVAGVAYAAASAAAAGYDLRNECARLDSLRIALVELRTEAAVTRGALDQLRGRSDSAAPQG